MGKYLSVYILNQTEHPEIILYYRYTSMLYTPYMSFIQIHRAMHYHNLKGNFFVPYTNTVYIFYDH
jgi:hypothetical protein